MLLGKRKLIIDRDTKYCAEFRHRLEQSGTAIIRLPPRSPNLNAYAERYVGSIKAECLNRLNFFGDASLRRAVGEFTLHYHQERNHQGLDNRLLLEAANDTEYGGHIVRRSKLGGMLNFYHRASA